MLTEVPTKPRIGIIGGSGLYNMPGLQDTQEFDMNTPFGKPSAPVVIGALEGVSLAFLARHGIGHYILPSEVNSRANIYALKALGVERIISISAVGSLREDFAPGQIVIPDQLIDFTRRRPSSFFGEGLVAHISIPDPFCTDLSEQLFTAVQNTQIEAVHRGGAMITIEGPRFSTRAESNIFRSWGLSLIGMTTSPEAFLAREAEMCYAVLAHVTDYDVWHISEEPVTVERVVETLNRNTQIAQHAVRNVVVQQRSHERSCTCDRTLADAILTHRDAIPAMTLQRLDLFVKKYL